MGDVVGDWLERNSARVGAVGALLGLAGSLVSVVVAAAALVSKHRLIALGLVVVAAVLFVLTWPRLRRRAWRASTQERLAQAEQQQRSRLIDSVFAWRIEQGLEASLRRVARVRVGLAHDPRLVQAEFGTDVTAPGVELSVQEAFERGQGRLLIAGEPGSGKTTLALELMRHLLEQARIDPTAGVPELFSLASWVRRPQPIVGWLEDELRQRGFGARWVREGWIIPILDGLDEVDDEHRGACLEAINDFRDFYEGRPLVVTCRLAEYRGLVADRPALAFGAGYVTQPLPTEQIIEYLEAAARANPAWGEVREAIAQGDADELCRLWSTPLLLTVTVLAYAQGDPRELLVAHSPTDRVWDVFVEAMRTRSLDPRHREPANPDATPLRGAKPRYTSTEVRRWLGWLASSPAQRGEIWLHQLEPPPDRHLSPRRAQAIATGLVFGLIFGLVIGVAAVSFTLDDAQARWLAVILVFGLIFGLLFGLVGALISDPRYGSGSLSRKKKLVIGLAYGLAGGLSWGLSWGLSAGLLYGHPRRVLAEILLWGMAFGLAFALTAGASGGLSAQPSYVSGWSTSRLVRRLAIGLFVGIATSIGVLLPALAAFVNSAFVNSHAELRYALFLASSMALGVSLLFGLFVGLASGLAEVGPPLDRPVDRPTHWLIESAKSGLLIGLIITLLFGLLFGLVGGLSDGLGGILRGLVSGALVGLSFGLFVGLFFGLTAGLWHVVLRLRCRRRGLLPLRLVTFLNWGADHLYLQHAGGAYRWAHPTLADYFASVRAPGQQEKPQRDAQR